LVAETVDTLKEQGTKAEHIDHNELPKDFGFDIFGWDEKERSCINWQNYYNFTDV
jgi:hypothetical protein